LTYPVRRPLGQTTGRSKSITGSASARGREARLAPIGHPQWRSPTSAALSSRQRPSASGVRRHGHGHCHALPSSTCLLFARVEALLLLLLLLAPSLQSRRLLCRPQTADRGPQPSSACAALRPPPLPSPPLHASPPSVAAIRFAERPQARPRWGLHYTVLAVAVAAAIRHTPSATTLGPVRGKRCRTGRPKIPTALGVNPLSATISSSHPTFLDLVDLEVTFPGRVVAIIASLYRRRR